MAAILNLVRGFLIGIAEVIPGVSGGTIALIVGVYQRIIDSAAAASRAILHLFRFRWGSAGIELRRIDFSLLLPLLIGMVTAIFFAARLLSTLLEAQPESMRGLFLGMILVSLYVPFRLVGMRWEPRDYALAFLAAAGSFGLLSLPRAIEQQPQLWSVFLVAMIAVCALVLPGVSGSFLLLTLGFYAPTIAAVTNLNFGYLAVFVFGAITGLALFSNLLSWLLENRRRITLVFMTGLMLGSLRAIWPWQSDSGEFLPISSFEPAAFMALGAALVLGIMFIERRVANHQ